MKKPVIVVDIDDVLSDENNAVLEYINQAYGLRLTPADYDIEAEYWGYWEKVWGVDRVDGERWFSSYIASGVKAKHVVLPGAIETISELRKNYKLMIITSRDDAQVELTHVWLDKYFPGVFSDIAFVHLWSGDMKASKAEIAIKFGASYLIDDNAEHCQLSATAGITALLFGNYGWNRSAVLYDGMLRVRDWADVREFFKNESARHL